MPVFCSVVPILGFCSTLQIEQNWVDFGDFVFFKCLFYIYNILYIYSSRGVCSVVPCFLKIGFLPAMMFASGKTKQGFTKIICKPLIH